VPIIPLLPEQGIVDIATAYAGSIVRIPGPHFLSELPSTELELTAPHRIYSLPLDAIRHGQLSIATFAGWRFLLVAGDGAVASVEVLGTNEQSVSINGGPFVQATADEIERLELLAEVQAEDYELRVLMVNALYLMAAWLVGKTQMIIPLDPAPAFIQAGRAYSEREFLDILSQPNVMPFEWRR